MNKKAACKINNIDYPSADRITSRISTLRRSMACTLMNRDACTPEQEQEWLKFFPTKTCAYCGAPATHLDHLHPMIQDNEPTGYGTDPGNLVPCCKNCNTPKGNMDWESFMRSKKCVHTAGQNKTVQDAMKDRIQNIKDFQKAMPAKHTSIDAQMKKEWYDQWNILEQELKKTEKMLLDMKRQLYGSPVVGQQKKPASTGKQSKAATASAKTGSCNSGKYTQDDKYREAAYYLRNNVGLPAVEKACLGCNNNGSTSKSHLNKLGIDTSSNSVHKGLLSKPGSNIDDEIRKAPEGEFKKTLVEIKKRGL